MNHTVTPGGSRRAFVGLALAAASGAALPTRHAHADTTTGLVLDRAYYDEVESDFYLYGAAKPSSLNEDGGKLAWGQSHVLKSYLTMYERFRDPSYLRLLVRNADQIFATRDSVRGVTDYSGRSLPAWRSRNPYTASSAIFLDTDQLRCLEIRAAQGQSIEVRVTIAHQGGDRFSIFVDHPRIADQLFSNLTMDESSPDYVVRRIVDAAPTNAGITVVDRRADRSRVVLPRVGTWGLRTNHYVMAVNTGMITLPIAEFCALVAGNPALQGEFGDTAARYADLVAMAVAVHDADWREAGHLGWYAAPRGAPVLFDGSDLPHNQYLVLATTQLHLHRVTGDPRYLDRARKMFTTFRCDLQPNGDGGLQWPYWWSRGNFGQGYDQGDDISDYQPAQRPVPSIEDTSHGVLELWAMLAGLRYGVVFGVRDLRAMAQTFVGRVAVPAAASPDGMPSTTQRVDGTSNTGAVGVNNRTAGNWALLTPWDPRVHHHLRALFEARQMPIEHGYTLNSVASIVATAPLAR